MKRPALITSILFLISSLSLAQDLQRAISAIDTLCSKEFFGRGYLNNGDKKAAAFIEEHFKNAGLKPLNKSYFQDFPVAVNTFPSTPALCFGKTELTLGEEFLPLPQSASGKGKGKVFQVVDSLIQNKAYQTSLLQSDFSGKVVVMQLSSLRLVFASSQTFLQKLLTASAWMFTTEKLTHSLAGYRLPIPAFVVATEKALPKKITWEVTTEMEEKHPSQNVIGMVEGTEKPNEYFVFSAHYDHLGGIGENIWFPGANDNASGIALLLELAYYYAENPPKQTVVFIAFGGEEAGLVGSKYFTENPLVPLEKISFLFNLDLTATGEKGGTIVNAKELPDYFKLLETVNEKGNYLPTIGQRGKAANSDHYYFFEKGVPSFFLYLQGAWTAYHDINDKPPLPLNRFAETFRLLVDFQIELGNSGK